jgi:mono/diheme cytochrome c family protein
VRPDAFRIACITALLLALPAGANAADETSLQLADGTGRDRVQAACSMCHSVDYIVMNSPFQDAAAWEKTVNKMVKVYGAPLSPEDAAAIVAYLGEHYGK